SIVALTLTTLSLINSTTIAAPNVEQGSSKAASLIKDEPYTSSSSFSRHPRQVLVNTTTIPTSTTTGAVCEPCTATVVKALDECTALKPPRINSTTEPDYSSYQKAYECYCNKRETIFS
ncbi:hypothetical protein HDV05_003025, partial [Chytridiales sp. JEL 0842]